MADWNDSGCELQAVGCLIVLAVISILLLVLGIVKI